MSEKITYSGILMNSIVLYHLNKISNTTEFVFYYWIGFETEFEFREILLSGNLTCHVESTAMLEIEYAILKWRRKH